LLAIGFTAATAYAGEKASQEVVFSATKPFATGDLAAVRNSVDTVQYLYCQTSGTNGLCAARNSAGVSHSCSTTDPNLLAVMRALNGDSYLVFAWNSDGTCKTIVVQNDSRYAPKQ
jgi:hypothetical protein